MKETRTGRQDYNGASPFPDAEVQVRASGVQVGLTGTIVVLPFIALGFTIFQGVTLADLLLAAVFYVVTGLGVTVGFHRLLTHGAFAARPWLRVVLGSPGRWAFRGNLIDWVAVHRRHRAFTDRPGDPHSPYRYGAGVRGQLRGLAHAHLGWMFMDDRTPATRYAPDLLEDPAMVTLGEAQDWMPWDRTGRAGARPGSDRRPSALADLPPLPPIRASAVAWPC